MKKGKILATTFGLGMVAFLAACGAGGTETPPAQQAPTQQAPATGNGAVAAPAEFVAPAPATPSAWNIDPSDPRLVEHGIEIRDGNLWFTEARTLNVGLWDRSHDRIPVFAESHWAQWVQEEIAALHNIHVEWATIPRWGEDEHQSTLLAGGSAPDIAYTFNNPMVTSFAHMGGITNLYPLLNQYRDLLPHMYDFLGGNIYWNLDHTTGELWSITGRLAQHGRLNTFIRQDWLDTLGLPLPATTQQFEDTLLAFRDNQDLLFPNRTRDLIPFQLMHDVGWTGGLVFEQFIPADISEREWFRYGFDDRRFMFEDAAREGTRMFNSWFHQGLLWDDFILHQPGDATGDDLIRLGYVGSFIQNWDQIFRPGDAFNVELRDNIGPDARFVAVQPFADYNFLPMPTDRFIYFPHTNTEQLASLLYLDFISRYDVLAHLQFGVEGIHHEFLPDGTFLALAEDDNDPWPDYMVVPSGLNFDITMTANGAPLEINAFLYAGSDPADVLAASAVALQNPIRFPQVSVGVIAAEEGMSTPLADMRDQIFHRMIVNVTPENFDAAWNSEYQVYLALGAAAIIAERDAAWVETFGDIYNR